MNLLQEESFSEKIDLGVWRRFFTYAVRFRREFIILALILSALALVENVTPLMSKWVIDHFIEQRTTEGLGLYSLVFFVLVCLQAVIIRFFLYYAGRIETGLCFEISQAGFARLQALSFAYYDRTPVGWIMARMVADTNRLSEVIAWGIVDIAWGLVTIIVIVAVLFLLDWRLALIALIVIPVLLLVAWLFQKRLLSVHRLIRRINSRLTGAFNEGIMGARTGKTLRHETRSSSEFAGTADELYRESVRSGILSALFLPIVSLLGAAGTALVLSVGSRWVVSGLVMTGTLYAFILYMTRIWDPIRHLARIMTELQSAQAAAERVMSLLAETADIADRPDVIARYGTGDGAGNESWPPMQGDIEFRAVSFQYEHGEPILEQFDLHVKAGQVIALIGETGAGKSTIVNLACRFYEPTAGQILIDGVDYRERPLLWLYANLGYVLQTPHLFSGSVAENIRYGKLSATQAEIEAAARLVRAHDFICRLEHGYETEVGEGGSRLSTGEKQLVSFARAILADPRLFVLDEATSSVDTETEQCIQQAIATVLQGRTAFVIAHRLSTIRQADRILVIDGGRIVESGSHQELLRRRGHYYQLYANQFIEESIRQASDGCA
jgi:ATP-binding cassette subfamily B protein